MANEFCLLWGVNRQSHAELILFSLAHCVSHADRSKFTIVHIECIWGHIECIWGQRSICWGQSAQWRVVEFIAFLVIGWWQTPVYYCTASDWLCIAVNLFTILFHDIVFPRLTRLYHIYVSSFSFIYIDHWVTLSCLNTKVLHQSVTPNLKSNCWSLV